VTKREALHILIHHAAASCAGVGCGIRTLPSDDEKRRVRDAIAKVYRDAYGREMEDTDQRNLNLRVY
jgi:hypothetical protein